MAGFERKWSLEREEKHFFLDKKGFPWRVVVVDSGCLSFDFDLVGSLAWGLGFDGSLSFLPFFWWW